MSVLTGGRGVTASHSSWTARPHADPVHALLPGARHMTRKVVLKGLSQRSVHQLPLWGPGSRVSSWKGEGGLRGQ